MSDKGVVREYIRAAEEAGLRVSHTKAGHIRVTGHGILLFAPGTPGDIRSHKNNMAQLRRALAKKNQPK